MNISEKLVNLKDVKIDDLIEKYFVGHGMDSIKEEFKVSGLYRIGLGCRGGWEDLELIEDESNVIVRDRSEIDFGDEIDEEDEESIEDYLNDFYGELGYVSEGYMFSFGEEDVEYFVRVDID